ncbi:hypothetical protein SKAU_G00041830 [Synaphobranchus kaupii]|uniref:UvrD-like helicase C-terminal domain-containing protein n=1 Tax=Synaphobranchus kaupii TaxID=118154 RepID=A0A9Q1G252_SYNKA|nr:hypothetical protein SKAU_G00041830 [Synaphobranchus kaupii]
MSREKEIVGYIIPKKDDKERSDDEDSDTEEDEPEFLDMNEIDSLSFGVQMINASRSRRTEVDLMDLQCGKQWRVKGRFAFSDPWWEVTCRVRSGRGKLMILQGAPFYRLRSCPRAEEARPILALFLKACGASPDHTEHFFRWLPQERAVRFGDLLETLREFGEAENVQETVAEQLRRHVLNSDAGRCVQVAAAYPQVMHYLPTLLPRRFSGLVQKWGSTTQAPQQNADALSKLEEMIKTEVWKLGFKSVLKKEAGLLRCEATLDALQVCRLWERIQTLQQNALLLYHQLKLGLKKGGTYMELEELEEQTKMYGERTWEAVQFLKEKGVVVSERTMVALADLHSYEKGIAQSLRHLLDGESWRMELDVRAVLRAGLGRRGGAGVRMGGAAAPSDGGEMEVEVEAEAEAEAELDADQVRAAQMICDSPVTVVSGKGGCGKTTVVCLVFGAALDQLHSQEAREVSDACRDFQDDTGGSQSWDVPVGAPTQPPQGGKASLSPQERIEVLLTAPTGRAAAVLTKRTKFTAYTLHQVIWSFMSAKKDETGSPEQWKFAAVRVLVVDEGSLVSVQLLHSVLHMLTNHACLQKFVLLGDVRQLPSIEPGNTLCDLFHCLSKKGCAIEMRTNHRAESQLIVRNAGLISERVSRLDFDATVRMDSSPTAPPPDKRFIHILLPEEQTDLYLQKAVLLLLNSGSGLEDDQTSQFIAFKRKECELINELCCKHYSQHTTRDHKKKLLFQPRDKVCCSRNGYVSDREKERELERERRVADDDKKKREVKERLCNGQIFFIAADVTEVTDGRTRDQKRYLTLDDREGRSLTVWFRELQKECKLQHAWARTIHTFQGSEAETIVYVLGNGYLQDWKHVYTAVTRGRKRVYVISTDAGLRNTVERWRAERQTRLGELARRAFSQDRAEGEESFGTQRTQPHAPHQETPSTGPKPAPTPNSTPSTGPKPAPTPNSTPSTGPKPAPTPNSTPSTGPKPAPTPNSTPSTGPKPAPTPNSTPSTGPKPAPTLTPNSTPSTGPTRSTPLPSHTSSQLQRARSSATPTLPGSFQKAGAGQDASSLDMAFTDTHTWSPMDPADTSCAEDCGKAKAGDSAGCRRPVPTLSTCECSPAKHPRLDPAESPLGSTRLQLLSLEPPGKGSRRLF